MDSKKHEPTVLVDHYRARAKSRGDGSATDEYPEHALPGLHENVEALVRTFSDTLTGRKALDLGAGAGAMSVRLHKLGFDVLALDYVEQNFRCPPQVARFAKTDLNSNFSSLLQQGADLVIAVEILEHLENPRSFLRQCHASMNPGAILVLTTPNIDSNCSKAQHVREGTFAMFRDSSYRSSGHITPISGWLIHKALKEVNLNVMHHVTFGSISEPFASRPKMWLFERLLRWVAVRHPWGDGAVHIVAARKGTS
jgi:2-polyprenyl-3-methyl-5-hydroxy-6-metoxy-1,4-benzoquinol methylase